MTLSLVLIAKNESRCISRCLKSAMPFVDETIVLDTGSTDKTIEIAAALGARVHHFEWCNDFAAARNAALAQSNASWNLVLDADEWIDDPSGWSALGGMLSADAAFVGDIRVKNFIEVGNRIEVAETWLPRLLPSSVRYRGRIHEQPDTHLPSCKLSISASHDGYLSTRAREKNARNAELLRTALIDEPDNAYLRFQAGVQHEVMCNWTAACEAYDQSMSLGGSSREFAHELGFRHLYALKQTGQYEKALQIGLKLREIWPSSSDIYFGFGDVCLDLACADPQNALKTWLPAAEAAWLRCLEIGESNVTTTSHVVGRGSFLAAHNLAVMYEGLGQTKSAERYRALAQQRPLIDIPSI